ncbi:MAG: hypothetical protein V4514_06900 [Pseudomonadota bacterium]|nr:MULTISPECIES: hypothetical protein [unclassified Phenylobacterium]MBT9470486.1 hypothetical protein [Phenylobacterium sp.]
MTRFSIPYEDPEPRKPPPSGWAIVRVFIWTLLLACVGLWCWAMLAA